MSKVYLTIGIVLFLTILASIASFSVDIPDSSAESRKYSEKESSIWLSKDWVKEFKRVRAYYIPPAPKPMPKPKPKPTVKKQSIEDSTLIGILDSERPAAMLVLPKKSDITYVKVGESWLSPWVLEEIHPDFIVWKNSEQGSTTKQKLF